VRLEIRATGEERCRRATKTSTSRTAAGKASKRPGDTVTRPTGCKESPGCRHRSMPGNRSLGQSCGVRPRVAILPPVPVPYREPLFTKLAERGRIEPRVLYLSGGQPGWDQRADWFAAKGGYPREVLAAWQRPRPGRSPLMVARGLGAALQRSQASAVVSWEYGPASWRALLWTHRRRVPLLVFSELTPWSDPELSRLQLRIHRLLAPRVAGFIVAGSQGVERLQGLGVDPARVEVALQSADVEPLRGVARPPRSDGPVRVLSVGRLVPDKNLGLLLEAWAAAGFAEGEAELEVRGGGPLESELRAQAERLGVPARFGGYASPADLQAAYSGADLLALVSTYEPFGVTVREAAAAGLPLICSRRAGAAGDVAVEGENALLVDPGSVTDVSEALRRLVGDSQLRARLAAGSRTVTERHPPEADAEAWERAVLRAIG
jgi:glycosyltransferase involved in cell wall biosynthesis